MTPIFLDPREVRRDLDAPLLAGMPPVPERLVFVVGLHRSGTTFLYQLLADWFPLATTQLYHVTHYRRLLHARREGLEGAYREGLAAYLGAHGLDTRGTDGIALHPGALEEYAFILRKFTPRWGFGPGAEAQLDELIRKLMAVQPEAEGLLLKNPHDFASVAALHARYPQARFVIIRRDPVKVLDSQLRAGLSYRRHAEYLGMLMAGVPGWAGFLPLWRLSRWLAPDPVYARLLVGMLARDIRRELEAAARAVTALPLDAYVEVSYEALMRDPGPALARIGALIGLAPRAAGSPIAREPRELALSAEVAAAAPAFRRAIAGLVGS